ncbi:hypothetical protein [uncultured Prevotella sp.]|uniref:hypothetical protein n=1 Tax=uncultured Prevotella sp. TaxID=159272 RepID=UPI0027E34D3F|nr:hypothetical protein [uncultured Prevotella sp.]
MRKLLRLLLIMLLTIVWTASRAQEITMDFTDNSGWNIPGKGETPNPPQTFGDGNNAITLSGGYYYYSPGSCLMLNPEATLTFSKFDFDVERIVVKGSGSYKASQDIFVGDTSVSGKVIAYGLRAFWINENSQAKGNVYKLKVTDYNASIDRIEIYKKGSFAPEGKAVPFVAGKDIAAGNSIMKDGVTISGKNIKFSKNIYGIYSFEKRCDFTISVQTGTIKKIEFLGDSYLEYLTGDENLSVSNLKAEWTGNAQEVSFTSPKGAPRVTSITVYVSLPTISLSESEDNTIETKSDISISLNRKLVKGVWNTICLPFDVSAAQAKSAFGTDVRIAALNAESKGNTLMFDNKTTEGIKAAVPYLIMPSEVKADDKYEFYNVSIKPENTAPAAAVSTPDGFAFKGIYNKVDITQDINNSKSYAAFLGANNTLFKAKANSTTKGFRAYFAIPNSTATSALRVVVDGNATSIKNINCGVVESDDAVYNLQGQRVDARSLMPGLYIKAGKKFVVR